MYTNAIIKSAICKNCATEFSQTRNQKYCSHNCYLTYKRNHPEEYRHVEYVSLICPVCGKTFQRNKIQIRSAQSFCSKKCSGTLTGGKARRDELRISSIIKPCEQCGKSFKTKGRRHAQRFCSRDCFNLHRSINGWGDNNPNYRHGQNQTAAIKTAKRHFDMKCIICGFDVVVAIHHIIPKSAGGNNNPTNLAVLCPNHHAMADRGLISTEELQSIISRIYLSQA